MEDENDNNLLSVKIALVGESGVGKTSIIKQFAHNQFEEDCISSISSQYSTKKIIIPEIEKEIKLDLWDTAGQEIYRSLAKIFYKDAKIIIFVYDITNKKSFEGIKKYWYPHIKTNSYKDIILALVGNKNDLYNNQQVEDEEVSKYAESIDALFFKTSAKSNSGIDLLFQILGRKFLDPSFDYRKIEENQKKLYDEKKQKKMEKRKKEEDDVEYDYSLGSIKLYKNNHKKKFKRKCC